VSSEVLHSTRSRPFGSRRRTKRRKSSPGIALNDTNEVSGEALMRSSCSHALPADACGARARDPSHLALCSASLACSHSDYLCLLSQQTSQTEGAAGGGRSSPAPGNGEREVTSAWACALMLTCSPCWRLPRARSPCWRLPCALPDFLLGALAQQTSQTEGAAGGGRSSPAPGNGEREVTSAWACALMLTCSPCWRLPRARSPCWRLPCALPDFLLGALARDPSHDFLLVVAVAPLCASSTSCFVYRLSRVLSL
jgi:hypothetical protein